MLPSIDSLTTDELSALTSLESTIAASEDAAVSYLSALREIRDRRLYRAAFPTFKAYCESKWYKSYRAINISLQADQIRHDPKFGKSSSHLSDTAAISLAQIEPTFQKQVLAKAKKDPAGPTAKSIKSAAKLLPSYQPTKSLDFSGAYSSSPPTITSKPTHSTQDPAQPLPTISDPHSAVATLEAIYLRDKLLLNSLPPRSPRQILDHLTQAILQ